MTILAISPRRSAPAAGHEHGRPGAIEPASQMPADSAAAGDRAGV